VKRVFNSPCSGFTLVELIVAITILSLVTLIIGNGFRLGMDAWSKGEAEAGATQRFRVLSGLMSQQLASAYPYTVEVEDEKVALFNGESDSVLFVTTIAKPPYGGFKWIRYSFKEGTFFLKEGILPDKDFEKNIKGDEDIVDSEIGEMKLTYFSIDDGDWKDSWDYAENLPGAVKVNIPYFQPIIINIPLGEPKEDRGDERE
jgi:general secretion pathway protein J